MAKKLPGLIGLVLVCLYAYRYRSLILEILAVFLYAGAFALLLSPLCRRLEARGLSSSVSAGAAVLLLVLLLLTMIMTFLPYLISAGVELILRIAPVLASVLDGLHLWAERFGLQHMGQTEQTSLIGSLVSRATAALTKGGIAIAQQGGRMVFALVLSFYLLSERKAAGAHLLLLVPIGQRMKALSALGGCKNAFLSYLSGMLKTSAFISLSVYIGLLLLGVRDAFLLSLLMGLLEILPYIGPVIAAVPVLLSALPLGPGKMLLALMLIVLVQQAESGFVGPYFTASSTSFHPLAALVGVYAFGKLFGLWGVLFAVPLMVMCRSVYWSVRKAEAEGIKRFTL